MKPIVFPEDATLEQKKKIMEDNANLHNVLATVPGMTTISCASCFSLAKQLVGDGEIAMAIYFLNLCNDPVGPTVGEQTDENDML